MKRVAAFLLVAVLAIGVSGCGPKATTSSQAPGGPGGPGGAMGQGHKVMPSFTVNKDLIYMHVTKTYNPADFQYASMNGEPSQIPYFKPTHDEGKANRDYPKFDAKTFKFLALPTAAIPPQDYYMFQKNGGTLNAALKGTGYKAADIVDTGHIKILPNLYIGYYDFAWVPMAVMTEYWSGNESMNQELWKKGNDYVVIGSSTDGDSNLIAPPGVTDLKQLDGATVGIMNVSFNTEALFNKKLQTVGLSTASAGGTVKIETGAPAFVMNDTLAGKLKAVFSWSMYTAMLMKQPGYHPLVRWQDMGYGDKVSNVVLVVRRDILAKHPAIVKKVVDLNYQATRQAMTASDWIKPSTQRYQQFNDTYLGSPAKVASYGPPNLDPVLNKPLLQDIYDYMVKCSYFKVPYKFGELVDTRFEDQIAK